MSQAEDISIDENGIVRISEYTRGQRLQTLFVFGIPFLLMGVVASVPLIAVLVNGGAGDTGPLVWLLLLGFSLAGAALVYFCWRHTVLPGCTTHITVENQGSNGLLYTRHTLGLKLSRRLDPDSVVLLFPGYYSHGDCGYVLWLKPPTGKRALLWGPFIVSYSVLEAQTMGMEQAERFAKAIGIEVEADKTWADHLEREARTKERLGEL